ncbi:rab GTPase-binding effector protein 1-like [Ctenocephalides felis]|uniref:rab GTPase-binding effector protein 1-like n=1 Tax=Ctenocephalides felis TaxID=7515 RepID=UPI000E6E1B09|nr:rab GTPase-binding effector protein 1-like [Ctenocephalides felis]
METGIESMNNDLQTKITSLAARITLLETEKIQERNSFDGQRAKMKDLFLQKEGEVMQLKKENSTLLSELQKLTQELDEAKSQLVATGYQMETDLKEQQSKAQEEIATLQQLVHETIEENSSSRSLFDSEISRLMAVVEKLQTENKQLRAKEQESASLAPAVVLSAMTKTLARKLGADSIDSNDETKKGIRHAQEDAEVLRSLVVPLEEEIKALKQKLRSADEQLQMYNQEKSSNRLSSNGENLEDTSLLNSSVHSSHNVCDMCSNYEAQLVRAQQSVLSLENKLSFSEQNTERANENIKREIQLRSEMQAKWEHQKDQYKSQVEELCSRTVATEKELAELKLRFPQFCSQIMEQLSSLTQQREQVHLYMMKLKAENENLLGKHHAHSQKLQSEMINLPDKVEELQELLLRSHEELIAAKVAAETYAEKEQTVKCEILLLRDQMVMEQQQRETLENSLVQENNNLKRQIHQHEQERRSFSANREKMEHFGRQYEECSKQNKQLELIVHDLRQRVASLQQELDNSEAVQKDFVRLSQSLQVELEKIRAEDTQVRWQHDEDVEECPTCRHGFNVTRRKQHCRHCGQIFCSVCLTHVVKSGPNSRPSRVCDVCHTLLVKETAPYFSTEPPHSPD